jgi:hypothetical protein
MKGRSVCYHHGGTTPTGLASPNTKHGRYSDHMPPPLAARHEADMERSAEIRKLDQDIVAIHGFICDSFGRMSSGERGTLWDDLVELAHDAQAENMTAAAIIERLTPIAAKGKETTQAQREVIGLIHDKAKITAIEAKRMLDSGEVSSKEEVKWYIGQTIQIFREAIQSLAPEQAPAIFKQVMADLPRVIKPQAGNS